MNVLPGRMRDVGRSRLLALAVVAAAALAILGIATPFTNAQDATPTPAAQCPTGTPTASPEPGASPAAGANCVVIEMMDIKFSVNTVTIPANQPVTIVLHNSGVTTHNFSITDHNNPNVENLNISVTVDPGQTQQVTVNAPAGTYYFFCNVPGHEAAGMWGWLIVQEGAQVSAQEATVTPPTS
jgi:uncharacterized cupredoxin-like copper-binding protein